MTRLFARHRAGNVPMAMWEDGEVRAGFPVRHSRRPTIPSSRRSAAPWAEQFAPAARRRLTLRPQLDAVHGRGALRTVLQETAQAGLLVPLGVSEAALLDGWRAFVAGY